MQQRALGNTTLKTPPLIFGGNIFGWTVDEKKSFELLDAFVGAGFNTIDTADVYSKWVPGNKGGESETIIGNWMKKKGNRDKVIIATKAGADRGHGIDVTAANIIRSCEESLTRLQTDHIDLYQTHYDDNKTPVEETLSAYTQLVKQGKVLFIGTSNMTAQRIMDSMVASSSNELARYDTLQPLYNLYDRESFEKNYLQLCLDQKISVIPYYSLASGFLTGKYRSEEDLNKSQRGGGIKKYLDARGFRILAALDNVSARLGATPAQVAIAWLIAQPAVTAAIASATSTDQLKDLEKATTISLSEEDRNELTKASD
jgi:aryl-alcohol dehydrogenase-like predicted oxidoreductase